ncbi:hypothetical protein MKW98_004879 [Papaver atlanticum]|uniref:Uncharacterized protein n=1 Tax=Papaver atlanticum TaxID=357466 RepID=A0AAD4RWX0_9MAGN|nr:hypothetical protein MKW98_004879 [Papaver atlanticum]
MVIGDQVTQNLRKLPTVEAAASDPMQLDNHHIEEKENTKTSPAAAKSSDNNHRTEHLTCENERWMAKLVNGGYCNCSLSLVSEYGGGILIRGVLIGCQG